MTEPTQPPRIEVSVDADPDLVWQALRDPALIRRWHGWHFDEAGGLDEEIRIIYVTGVTEDPTARTLTLSDGDQFSLHPTEEGTVVRVTRAPRGTDPEWDAYYDDITEGWQMFLQQLRFAVERHHLSERRTIMLTGQLASEASLVDALNLAQAAALPVGAAYQATANTGDQLTGTVWARAAHQLALTVDGLGDGLLVLAEQPATPHRPAGGALLVLTAYGLADAEFSALENRWTRWWKEHQR